MKVGGLTPRVSPTARVERPARAHAMPADEVLAELDSSPRGLSAREARERLAAVGPNRLPAPSPPRLWAVFLRQFANPLIYVLLGAALLSAAIGDFADAGFILAVVLINAAIGAAQERSAERSAQALRALVTAPARVVRDGESVEVDAEEVVPGDLVLLEAGNRVPADVRLIGTHALEVDESLLTGESLAVLKEPDAWVDADAPLGDRRTMAYAGTLVSRGRGRGVVVATGTATEVGKIAADVAGTDAGVPPLVQRMESFSRRVALVILAVVTVLGALAALRGMPLQEVFLVSVALAVSVIPEGLPVALTVALSIATHRMSRRKVIVRRLAAVEALGSCTLVASDKTGTLTMNHLTARRVVLPGRRPWTVTGDGACPEGRVQVPPDEPVPEAAFEGLRRLGLAIALCNEGALVRRDAGWCGNGDPVDVALLALAGKLGLDRCRAEAEHPPVGAIPFEPERRFAATLHRGRDGTVVYLKGAPERVIAMCSRMLTPEGERPIDPAALERDYHALADHGHRVLAVATGTVARPAGAEVGDAELRELLFLGLVGMIDPPRPEARGAVEACQRAGLEVTMVTGDHPRTALAIARELGIAAEDRPGLVLGGAELARLRDDPEASCAAIGQARVLARVEPSQKLEVVRALQRAGHLVAVTGDGANDASALRAANVGVAMGRKGTDVARESAHLVLADDNFASLAAGVEEGRIAYANVRKVVFLLASTGTAEVVLFALALATGHPMPLIAVQLLWLNLVTSGIQHIGLASEPGEGDELSRPPRPPSEPIFDRLMIERCLVTALVVGVGGFLAWRWLLAQGWSLPAARNGLLLLMVLFQNVQVLNARSERRSCLRQNPLRNPLLIGSILGALGIHVASLYVPGLSRVLHVQPVGATEWLLALLVAAAVILAIEAHKLFRWARGAR